MILVGKTANANANSNTNDIMDTLQRKVDKKRRTVTGLILCFMIKMRRMQHCEERNQNHRNPPPGVDPFVFASLPYEMQKEQREIYERERQDREFAQRLAKEEQTNSAKKKKKKKKKKTTTTGLTPPPGVDITTFSALPRHSKRSH